MNKYINVNNLEKVKEADRLRGAFRFYEGPDYDMPSIWVSPLWDKIWEFSEEYFIITDVRINECPEFVKTLKMYGMDIFYHGKNITCNSNYWFPVGDEICVYKGPDVREYERTGVLPQ